MKFLFDEAGMLAFAQSLGEKMEAGDLLVLTGDLGSGKTTFTKGLGLGLGVTQMIKSPTFTVVREYKGRLPLYHMDVYRVGNDPDSFDLDHYLEAGGVSVIEWGELLGENLPDEYLSLTFIHTRDDLGRELILTPHGPRYEDLLKWF